MKVRNGFVSNSSSASFVLYGFPVSKLPLGIQRAIDGEDYISDINLDVKGKSNEYVGTIIKYCSNEYSGEVKVIEDYKTDDTPEDLEKHKTFIKKGFKEYFGIDIPDDWFKTFYLEYYA